MRVETIKAVDKYAGVTLGFVLGLFKIQREFVAPKRILFIQVWGIGETILTLPTIKHTRRKFPRASIEVLVTARSRPVYEGNRDIDIMHEVELSPAAIAKFMIGHVNEFDLMVDLEEYLNISALIGFFVGKYRVGYANQSRSRLYDKTVAYNDRQHVAETYFDLVRLVGVEAGLTKLPKLPKDKKAQEIVDRLFRLYKLSGAKPLVGFGTGAAESSRSRKWIKVRFAELADRIIENYKARVVFFGSDFEANEIDGILSLMRNKAMNLAGKTSVKQLFAAIGRMNLFIGNDSGPMHIAASQGVKTIGLFGPNLPQRFGPFGPGNSTVYKPDSCELSPCINVHLGQTPDCLYPKNSPDYQKCMNAIEVDDVMRKVQMLMK